MSSSFTLAVSNEIEPTLPATQRCARSMSNTSRRSRACHGAGRTRAHLRRMDVAGRDRLATTDGARAGRKLGATSPVTGSRAQGTGLTHRHAVNALASDEGAGRSLGRRSLLALALALNHLLDPFAHSLALVTLLQGVSFCCWTGCSADDVLACAHASWTSLAMRPPIGREMRCTTMLTRSGVATAMTIASGGTSTSSA